MIQNTLPSDKQRKVSALRDSIHGRETQANAKKPRSEVCGDVVAVTNGKGKNLMIGSGSRDHSNHRPKEAESLDLVMKRAGFDVTAKGNVGSGRCDPVRRNFNPPRESKVKLLSSEESKKLLASQSTRRPVPVTIKKKTVLVKAVMKKKKDSNPDASRLRANANKATQHRDERRSNQRGPVPVMQQNQVFKVSVNAAVQKKDSNSGASRLRANANKATQYRDERRSNQREPVPVMQQNRVPKRRINAAAKNHPIQAPADQDDVVAVPEGNGQEGEIRNADYDPSAREKVLEVLRFFKQVFKRLDREKQERRGGDLFQATSRIDIKTLDVIENMGKKVNVEKRIGSVPGIEVGDEFQYKTELRAVGLHSKTMWGVEFMKIGDMTFATCIVASESYGYNNKFDSGVIVYTGEGGNVTGTGKRIHNQRLTNGNLALANSMREEREVRVIRGKKRGDRRGKRYVYLGLYIVEKLWEEEERGKMVYKFRLCRIPGQPPLN